MKINLIVLCDKRLYLNVGRLRLARLVCLTGDGKALVRRPLSSSVTLMSSVFCLEGIFSLSQIFCCCAKENARRWETCDEGGGGREETCKHVLESSLSQEVCSRNMWSDRTEAVVCLPDQIVIVRSATQRLSCFFCNYCDHSLLSRVFKMTENRWKPEGTSSHVGFYWINQ